MIYRFLLFSLSILIFACNSKYDNSHLSIFKYNESNSITSLDPAFSKDKSTNWLCSQIYNQLVKLDDNLNVIPSIAKRWSVSENGLKYTFLIRDDVFFHNHINFEDGIGRKVIASDFEFSFNRLINPKLASTGSWVLNNVDNFFALNDSVFIINLRNPFPPFLSLLSMQYCSVVPNEIYSNISNRNDPVGTGPFKFQFWKEGVKLVLRKNETYFEKENGLNLPYLDAVSISFIKDKQSEFLSFLQGNLDFISGINSAYTDEILDVDGNLKSKYSERFIMQKLPFLNTEYLGFLMDDTSEISKNRDLRKSINFAIDRDKMLKFLRNNIGFSAHQSFIPKGMNSFTDSLIGYSYNLDSSLYYLNKSGIKLEDFKLTLSTTSSYVDLCEFIQSELNKIGINLKLDINTASTHRNLVANSKLSFFRGSWIADYPDAENYLSLFYSYNKSPKGPNYTHFDSYNFDRLYELAIKETDESTRISIYQKLDKIIIREAVIVPLYYDQVVRFFHKNINNFNSNAQNSLDLTRVSKD
tara:strand:+ start:38083 stop:39663 length:1581 start_codon:yes stop_codon:yes gene_type:complete